MMLKIELRLKKQEQKNHTQSQVIAARFFELSLSLICHILLIRLFSIVVNWSPAMTMK